MDLGAFSFFFERPVGNFVDDYILSRTKGLFYPIVRAKV